MRHLYLIGNGFDLAHGLETSYRHFIIWYLQKKLNSILEKQHSGINENDGLFEIKREPTMTAYNVDKKIVEPTDFISIIQELNDLTSFKFIYSLSELLKEILYKKGWADIEKTYYKVLLKTKGKIESVIELNKSLSALKSELIEYLQNNVETEISQKNPKKNIEYCLFYDKPIGNNIEFVKGEQMFVNFNYTKMLNRYENFNPMSNTTFVNIHGNACDSVSSIIFGYGDEMDKNFTEIEDEDDNEYLVNMKSFAYFKTNSYSRILDFIEEDDVYVHIIGHSLGLSDRLLLNTVFEHKNCKKIEIHYHKESENFNNFNELTMNMSRHFHDKDSMRRKVVPFPETRPMD